MEDVLRQYPRRYAAARAKPLADGAVTLFHPATREFITINPLAAFLWELSTGHETVSTLAREIHALFPEQADVERDVIALVRSLVAKQFLALSRTPGDEDAAERGQQFDVFATIFCLNLDSQPDRLEAAMRRYETLGIAGRVERFAAIPTPENHHRGCTLSWRSMIAEAARRSSPNMLGLEDDALFLDNTLAILHAATAELARQEWDLFYLGACVWAQAFPFAAGCMALQVSGPVTGCHAVAVHERAYARILADIPAGGATFDAWMNEYLAIDQYFSQRIADGTFRAFITAPRVASQPVLLHYENADRALASRYVI